MLWLWRHEKMDISLDLKPHTWVVGPPEVTAAAQPEAQEDASVVAEVAEQSTAQWFLSYFQRTWERIALYKASSSRLQLEGIDLSLTAFGARHQSLCHDLSHQQGASLSPLQSAFLPPQQQQPQLNSGVSPAPSRQNPQPTHEAAVPSSSNPNGAVSPVLNPTVQQPAWGPAPVQQSPTQQQMLTPHVQPTPAAQHSPAAVPVSQSAATAEHRKVHRRYEQPAGEPDPPEGLAGRSRRSDTPANQASTSGTPSEAAILATIAAGLQLTRHKHIVLRQWGLTCSVLIQPPSWLVEHGLQRQHSTLSAISAHPTTPEVPVSPDSRAAFAMAAQDSFSITDDSKGMRDVMSPRAGVAGRSCHLTSCCIQ